MQDGGQRHFEFHLLLTTRLLLHKIWHVYYVWGPTCMCDKILNKNKIQDGGGHYLAFLHKQQ